MTAIEVIAIGSELLAGLTINTNVAFIGKKLLQEGFSVDRQTVVADEFDILTKTFKEALERSKVVIVTGGLGPTLDDITKNAAASLFNSDFKLDENVVEDLKNRFGNDLPTLINQSTVPTKAIVLKNEVGTAPGFIFTDHHSILILMPGVPKEMEPMMMHSVIPYLKSHGENHQKSFSKSLYLYGLYESTVDPVLCALKAKYPKLAFGIYPGEGKLSVVISSHELAEFDAKNLLDTCLNELKSKFQAHIFDFRNDRIEEAIHELFIQKKMTLSVAESCTGGKISAKLTALRGASFYFLGSIVCYSNLMKTICLSVPEKLLKEKGAVSSECVNSMAASLLDLTGSDYSLAVSGIAGPDGGSPEKPVGTVFGSLGFKGERGKEIKVFKFQLLGDRSCIMEAASNMLLFELYKILKGICPIRS